MIKFVIALIVALAGIAAWQGYKLIQGEKYSASDDDGSIYEDFILSNQGHRLKIDNVMQFNQEMLPLDSVASSGMLFAYFSPSGCQPCKDMTLGELIHFKSKHPKVEITFLISDIKPRDLYVLEKENVTKFRFFRVNSFPFDQSEMAEEDITSPVLFQLKENRTIDNFYVVEYGNVEGIKKYLNHVKSDSLD